MVSSSKKPDTLRGPIVLQTMLAALLAGHLLWEVRLRDAFTWMDPEQYYRSAAGIASGAADAAGLLVATVYPFLLAGVLAVRDTIPAALAVHGFWLLVLAAALYRLARRFEIAAWAPVALLLLMAGPAMYGLSRELYLEFPLTALVTLHYAVWMSRNRRGDGWLQDGLFGALLGLGFAIKMTYPVFLLGPIALEAARAIRDRTPGRILRLLAVTGLPILLVMVLFHAMFPGMFRYYLSLGNTGIPTMRLIGPPEIMSRDAAVFYPLQIVRHYLGPWFALALAPLWYAARPLRGGRWDAPRLDLWAWALIPILVFTWMPVREVRHIAPAMPPLALLAGIGLKTLTAKRRPVAALAIALAALIAYAWIASGRLYAPYRLTRPLRPDQLLETLHRLSPPHSRASAEDTSPDKAWLFSRSFLIAGFDPNEALGLAWAMAPATTLDLEELDQPPQFLRTEGYRAYADVFLLSAFNLYNRRAGWSGRYEVLSLTQALAHADALIIAEEPGAPSRSVPEGFAPAARIDRGRGAAYRIYTPAGTPDNTYRRLYAETFLRRNPILAPGTLHAVRIDLEMDALFRHGEIDGQDLDALFPDGLAIRGDVRTVYYLSVYQDLLEQFRAWNRRQQDPPGRESGDR